MCSWYHEGWAELVALNPATGEEYELIQCSRRTWEIGHNGIPKGIVKNPKWEEYKPRYIERQTSLPLPVSKP